MGELGTEEHNAKKGGVMDPILAPLDKGILIAARRSAELVQAVLDMAEPNFQFTVSLLPVVAIMFTVVISILNTNGEWAILLPSAMLLVVSYWIFHDISAIHIEEMKKPDDAAQRERYAALASAHRSGSRNRRLGLFLVMVGVAGYMFSSSENVLNAIGFACIAIAWADYARCKPPFDPKSWIFKSKN